MPKGSGKQMNSMAPKEVVKTMGGVKKGMGGSSGMSGKKKGMGRGHRMGVKKGY